MNAIKWKMGRGTRSNERVATAMRRLTAGTRRRRAVVGLGVTALAAALVSFAAMAADAPAANPAAAGAPANAASMPTQGSGVKRTRPVAVQQSFATPELAGQALADAMRSGDVHKLYAVLGPGSGKVIRSGDAVDDNRMRERFVTAYGKSIKFEPQGDDKTILLLGDNEYPFPFPLVKNGSVWRFDTKSGAEEVLNRRIGRNELDAMQVCLAYVDAQREYVLKDRDNNGLLEYAQKLVSAPGKQDGLYWETKAGEQPSPLGPLGESAKKRGYGGELDAYHGYRYKILTGQGANAPGGAYSYLVKGKMIAGFALVAYPARWNASGVMTFTCSHTGDVYQKNLGRETATVAPAMNTFDPGDGWTKADDAVAR